jgi:hypothetical protein
MANNTPGTLKDVRDYFKVEGQPLTQFGEEWKQLSDKDKAELKQGIGDGSLTY